MSKIPPDQWRQSATLTSAIQHGVPPELGEKRGTEFINTRFPLSSLLYEGYKSEAKKKEFIIFTYCSQVLILNISLTIVQCNYNTI